MPRTNVRATRYAEAAFGVARQDDQIDDWLAALGRSAELIRNRTAGQYLSSPVVSPDRKVAALAELLPDLPRKVGNFLEILAQRDRLELLPEILTQVARLANEHRGIAVARVTTAVPLESGQRELIAGRLAARVGRQITMETHVDPTILGGVVAQIGDDVIDGSVRGRLERLRRTLAEH